MFKRKPHTPYGLSQVARELRRTHGEPDQALNLEPIRTDVSKLVTSLAADHSDDEIEERIDRYVETHIADSRRTMAERHFAGLTALDLLDAEVSSYLVHFEELSTDERGKLAEIEGVVAHIWDRVSEPDTPHIDPIR